jgi:cytochrome d ubiquinol oxidase subunit II
VRALAAGAVTGAVALLDLVLLREHARTLFDGLVGAALPLVIVSLLCGLGALFTLARRRPGSRPFAIGALAAVICGWGVAQHPDILPGELTIDQAAAPDATLTALLIVTAAAVVIVVPALVLLITLHQRALLQGDEGHAGD